MVKERLFVVTETVLQEALNYLGSRPWAEVDKIIVGLRSTMIELSKDSTHGTILRELDRLRTRRVVKSPAPEENHKTAQGELAVSGVD